VGTVLYFPQFYGRFHVVRRQIGNKWIERILFNRFYKAGLNIIPKRNSIDRVLEVLAKNDVVTFIMDQYAKPGREGILVDFFGEKVGTFKSLALIASASGAPVIPMISYRDANGKHVMKFYEPLSWIQNDDPDEELYQNTLAYNRVLEKRILEKPDQWIWMHKRWKVKK
jgi:KDO2-lipid IV(A) lauroyltransferase